MILSASGGKTTNNLRFTSNSRSPVASHFSGEVYIKFEPFVFQFLDVAVFIIRRQRRFLRQVWIDHARRRQLIDHQAHRLRRRLEVFIKAINTPAIALVQGFRVSYLGVLAESFHRELFVVKSPADGIVYYGRCSQGNFASASSLVGRLQRGGMIQPDEVLMTIVQPRPLFIRASADERESQQISAGMACKVSPAATPDSKLEGKIDRVSATPITSGTFDVRASFEAGNAKLYPGMACTLKLTPYQRDDALVAPAGCIFSDDFDEDKMHVYVWRSDAGKFEKKSITIGKKSGSKVEVKNGVKAGDDLALTKPDAKELTDGK